MDFSALYTRHRSTRSLNKAWKTVRAINALEPELQALTLETLRFKFLALASRPFDARLVEGFALVREVSRRVLGLRQFDVQLIGGLTLLQGQLAEMRTGEGKTLTIAAPAALRALDGRGVHVVTANSYLANRDAALMRPLYEALGLSVAFVSDALSIEEKQAAYAAHITYGVGHEFGFDYLRDNMVITADQRVQRGLHAAIVDEVDSILIDEARVPLIISAQAADVSDVVLAIDTAVAALKGGVDFEVNLKEQSVVLTEVGYGKVEHALVEQGVIDHPGALYELKSLFMVRRIHAAAKAYSLFRKDRDYVIEAGELVLVDQGTGRKMPGRRFEDGLHEALEAKEGLKIQSGTLTRATVTYQNFFGLYAHLAGLTGTAATDAEEFAEIYNLETVVIPTNRPIQRQQLDDVVFLTKNEKFSAVVDEVARRHQAGQPVLLGCATIRDAEVVSQLLRQKGVAHETLTAKYLEREAHIIAQAGRKGAVTVATNMAGRGTDISLGGEKPSRSEFEVEADFDAAFQAWSLEREAVLAAGGLFVLGTERNGLRRVDNQLAGRSGRQGDPGLVQFYLSLEDELLSVFGQSRGLGVVRKLVSNANGALSGKHVNALVTTSQKKYEGQGFDARRTLMKFDGVLAAQRKAVYALREALLEGGAVEHCRGAVLSAMEVFAKQWLDPRLLPEQWDLGALKTELMGTFGLNAPLLGWVHKEALNHDEILDRLKTRALEQFDSLGHDEAHCRQAVFSLLTEMWTEHLTALEELRQSVSLKANTGLNPVFQFSKDAFELFSSFEQAFSFELGAFLLNVKKQQDAAKAQAAKDEAHHAAAKVAIELEKRWVRRNDPCPCGSGKRYRECHGKLA